MPISETWAIRALSAEGVDRVASLMNGRNLQGNVFAQLR